MENTTENKARFFALYYGQRVLCIRKNESPELYVGFDDMRNNKVRDDDFLSLRSISSLTDEECLTIARRCYRGEEAHTVENGRNIANVSIQDSPCFNSPRVVIWTADYLRSIGILIPWMDLSVEQIIYYGWAKEDTSC